MLSLTTLLLLIHQNAAAESGKATMYGGNLDGNACGMDGTADAFENWMYAAIGSTNFDDGYGCGKCYTITCNGPYGDNPSCECSGSITVQAIDQCPECDDDHFDLNSDALASLTGGADMAGTCGVVSITYERVDCLAITGNFKVTNKGGTSEFWYGFHLDDVNDDGGIKSVSLLKDGSQIATCDKSGGPSFWLCNGGASLDAYSTPLDIKITSDLGTSVTASNCITSFSGGAEMECNTNLGGGSTTSDTDDSDESDESEEEDTSDDSDEDSDTSSDGTIKIKENANSNVWWIAIEFPNNNNDDILKLQMKDDNHNSWVEGSFEDWGSGAYSFTDGTQFSGAQHFKVTNNDGKTATTYNAFGDLSAGSTTYLNLPSGSSSYTEEEETEISTSTAFVAAIIAGVLLACLLCIAIGACIMKRRKEKAKQARKETKEDSGVISMSDDTIGTAASTGYDMSPIDTTAV